MELKETKRDHYISNKDFSVKVVEYVNAVNSAKTSGSSPPRIPEYIGECFLKIAEGLSRRPNFVRYSYREEMVMDAVENCLKAIMNYNVNAPTRTGIPNAFSYFTQICFFAFLRRIAKEKRQQEIKERYIIHAGIDSFADFGEDSADTSIFVDGNSIVERVRSKIETLHEKDSKKKSAVSHMKKTIKQKEKSSYDIFAVTV
jgi:hypothetical protein